MRTVSIASPDAMAEAALLLAEAAVLKVKVDGGPDLARVEAVHRSAPNAALVVDPNESWTEAQLERWLPELRQHGVVAIEQPLPAGHDECLRETRGMIPFVADESFHDRRSFDAIDGRYDIVNLKLDKTGGLTEAIACLEEARTRGLGVMVGCMVSTTLAIAPALTLAVHADFVDLDGPLLLVHDRDEARHDAAASLLRSSPELWGGQPPRSVRSRA